MVITVEPVVHGVIFRIKIGSIGEIATHTCRSEIEPDTGCDTYVLMEEEGIGALDLRTGSKRGTKSRGVLTLLGKSREQGVQASTSRDGDNMQRNEICLVDKRGMEGISNRTCMTPQGASEKPHQTSYDEPKFTHIHTNRLQSYKNLLIFANIWGKKFAYLKKFL